MKKKIKIMLIIFITLAALCFIWVLSVNAYVKASTKDRIITADEANKLEGIDCIIVLGCLVRPDGNPSGMLEDRLITAIELYENGVSSVILMSGDHGTKEYDEVNAMRSYAVSAGIPIEKIFMDHAGFCTYDSIYRLRDIFSAKKVVIVTQEYHLYRSLYIAEQLGIEAWGVSADRHTYRKQALRDIREIFARNKDFLTVKLNIKPKYLGEKIDLTGDGRITNG